jgi:hypothetical protein
VPKPSTLYLNPQLYTKTQPQLIPWVTTEKERCYFFFIYTVGDDGEGALYLLLARRGAAAREVGCVHAYLATH